MISLEVGSGITGQIGLERHLKRGGQVDIKHSKEQQSADSNQHKVV